MRESSQRGALRRWSGSWAVPVLLLLAGCRADEAGTVAGAPAGAGAAAPPAAKADAAKLAAALLAAQPVLTADGWGPLRIGMRRAEVEAALGPDSDPAEDGGPEPESCDQFRPARAPEGLLVMIEDARLSRISLHDGARIATDKGLRVGATRAEVKAAHGPELRSEPHEYESPEGEYLTVWTREDRGPDASPARRREASGTRSARPAASTSSTPAARAFSWSRGVCKGRDAGREGTVSVGR
jgi:hypothetical protein